MSKISEPGIVHIPYKVDQRKIHGKKSLKPTKVVVGFDLLPGVVDLFTYTVTAKL
jgi:hypothetical protein